MHNNSENVKLIDLLSDSEAVYKAFDDKGRRRTSEENMQDVLDALKRLVNQAAPNTPEDTLPTCNSQAVMPNPSPASYSQSELMHIHGLIKNATVSVDVSTCDEDAGNRLFGSVYSVQSDGDSGLTILVCDTEANFPQYDGTAELVDALETIAQWPDGGANSGQDKIKLYARARLLTHENKAESKDKDE